MASGRILLVDDGRVERRVAAALLQGEGYVVVTAGSALGALEMLGGPSFNLAIVDQHLPDLTGTALITLLRREYLAPPPIAMLSTDASAEAAARAAGAVAFASKPARKTGLLELATNHARLPPRDGHGRLLNDMVAKEFVATRGQPDERRALVSRWTAELLLLLESIAQADAPGRRHRLHQFRGCAAIAGAERLERAAGLLEATTDALFDDANAGGLLALVEASSHALMLRASLQAAS